jgi:hypothetical protein
MALVARLVATADRRAKLRVPTRGDPRMAATEVPGSMAVRTAEAIFNEAIPVVVVIAARGAGATAARIRADARNAANPVRRGRIRVRYWTSLFIPTITDSTRL